MIWLNCLLLLAVVVGHAGLMITLVNRTHGLPMRHAVLRKIRHLHDLLIPTFAITVLWFVGISGPGLLRGGSWLDLHFGWSLYFIICGCAIVGMSVTIIGRALRNRWLLIPNAGNTGRFRKSNLPFRADTSHLRTTRAVQLKDTSRTVDIKERLGKPPLCEGPYQFMTRVPGNEIFRIQLAEKSFRLPRLPTEWDDLSILHLTDLHLTGTLDRPFFEEIADLSAEMNADMIVFTGDLIDEQKLVEWLPSTLGRLDAPLGCYYILGNHDWNVDPKPIRETMNDLGWCDVSSRCEEIEIHGRTLAIGGTEKPWMGEHPDFSATSSDAFRLLLSHTPDNIKWARGQNVDLMLSGHNHGGQVRLPLIGPLYSPSVYGTRYASGAFWEDPTLLYVSRGISGQHPLRIRCQPELTKLVLRAQTLRSNQPVESRLEMVSV